MTGRIATYHFAPTPLAKSNLMRENVSEDKILVTGTTTGALIQPCDEIRFDLKPVETATRGQHISIKVNDRVRVNDKLYVLQPADRLTQMG